MTVAIAGFILSGILAIAYGAAFHLFVGGNLPSILIYLVASALGFGLGHFIGLILGIETLRLGAVYLLTASLGSWTLLIFTRWFLNPPPKS
ncbi:MAG: hypothetical protein ACI9EW_001915 [Cellvibrionaceae bacterium]|jgi:hypothetical protein